MRFLAPLILALTTPVWAKTDPAELLTWLEKSYTERVAEIPAADDKGLQAGDRLSALLHLRYLTVLESILAGLNTTEENLKKQIDIDELTGSEKKRMLELRMDALEYRAASLASPDFKEPRTSPIEKIQKAYERKARKPTMELAKAQKARDQEYERSSLNERKVDELSEQIKEHKKSLTALKAAFFGANVGKAFELPIDQYANGPASDLLAKVITTRDQLLVTLRIDPLAVANNAGTKQGEVGGINFKATNLGVILDNSSSMQPHIPALKKEIDKNFPGSHYREIYGCALTWNAAPKTLGQREQVILSMEDLIIVKKTDAIYWFSDLRDAQTPAGLARISELFDRSGAAFYASSVDQKPKDELEPLITKFSKFKK
ncbi:MAG: hypothetical protein CBC46_07050 [Verrucomicrobiaceae bacterium TMED86]|nr:MAG: hypothetical protein CBC46_07050 [Verrucomicrobiaceae bacterium TMED86]